MKINVNFSIRDRSVTDCPAGCGRLQQFSLWFGPWFVELLIPGKEIAIEAWRDIP